MGACGSVPNSKSVIVVGAGYAGTAVAKQLDSIFDVTLVEPQDALHHKVGALRGAVVPGWEKRVRIPLDRLLKRGKIVRGSVASVTSGEVTLEDGTKLNADFIVLCHGGPGRFAFPNDPVDGVFDSKTVIDGLKAVQSQIAAAGSILIVGGGPVGVELAGEIKAHIPTKKVTLVHSHDSLLSNSVPPVNPAIKTQLMQQLNQIGVEVKLGARVTGGFQSNEHGFVNGKREYTLSDGSKISADLAFLATGSRSAQSARNIVGAAFVDGKNLVKVDDHLRVIGMDGVFCCGDANNFNETKLAFTGGNQAAYVVKSLKSADSGKGLAPYVGLEKPGAQYGAMFVPLGPRLGSGGFDTTVMGSYMVSTIKGKGLFTKKYFGDLNAVRPEL